MNNNIVKVKVRHSYGRTLYDPGNEYAEVFAVLAGSKTLTIEAINHIKRLGFLVLVEYAPGLTQAI